MAGTAVPSVQLQPRGLISRKEMTSSSGRAAGPLATPFVRWMGPTCQRRSAHVLRTSRAGDADKVLDELLNKYGKVVYTNYDSGKPKSPSPSSSFDDDSESLSLAVALANSANEVKAEDIRVLYVKPLVYWTRYFIIATAFSNPQINAIASKMRDIAELEFNKVATGDTKPNAWTLLDFGDVVVHIFQPQQRTYYNLEEFYGNATPIELPFPPQQQIFISQQLTILRLIDHFYIVLYHLAYYIHHYCKLYNVPFLVFSNFFPLFFSFFSC